MTSGKYRYRVGVDENGLGPRLGPMTVTAVLAEVDEEGDKRASKKPRGKLAERLGDSKGLVSHGDIALGEAWTRVLVARGAGRAIEGANPDALFHAVSLDDREALTRRCPEGLVSQCFSFGEFQADDALMATLHKDLDTLASKGIRVISVRTIAVCTERLNDGVSRGLSRFAMDLHAMERLILAMRDIAGADVRAVCGKVGGYDFYGDAFGPLAGRLFVPLEEGRKRSAYRFPGVGDLEFVQDSDASDLLVSLASLVGKYVREILMASIVTHYRAALPDLPEASGYHDPITAKFVAATKLLRRDRKVPGDCFERKRMS